MINHPLFNDDTSDAEKQTRDIGYINIYEFQGSKRVALVNQWDPETLTTIEDLYDAVGAGHFELVGRDARTKKIVDRVTYTLKHPKGFEPAPTNAAPARQQPQTRPDPEPQPPAAAPQPTMVGNGIVIPQNMDPNAAMILTLVMSQGQLAQQQTAAQREDSRFHAQQMSEMMLGFTRANTEMVVGLVQGLAGRSGASGEDRTADAFIKGVETMVNLSAGLREGQGEGNPGDPPQQPTQWSEVVKNIAEGIKNLRDVVQVANAAAPGGPVVPPGGE